MSANERVQWLHKRICAMDYPNATHLSERFGISHRQAQRDVELLRNELAAPLAFDAKRRGFYYTAPFSLPAYVTRESDVDFAESVSGKSVEADAEIVQMQIPYTAELQIHDKLALLDLQQYVVKRLQGDRYLCEFHSIDLFLGLLFTAKGKVTLHEPVWLRERFLENARRVIENNSGTKE